MTTYGRIQMRRDSAADWVSTNPILLDGEIGIITDTGMIKIGDGASAWNALPIFGSTSQFAAYLVWDAIDSMPQYIAAGDTAADAREAIGAISLPQAQALITALIDGAPENMNTLKELADALEAADVSGILTALGGKQPRILTGICDTAAATAAKVSVLTSPWEEHLPAAGDWFLITFTNGTTTTAPTMAVNGATARPIRVPQGTTAASSITAAAGAPLLMYFDGTNMNLVGATHNSSYSEISEAGLLDIESSDAALISGRRLEAAFLAEIAKARTLTNKSLSNPFITNYTETVQAIGNTGTSQTINITSGTVKTATLTGNCTFTMPTATAGKSFTLYLKSGAGGFAAAFTGVKWPGSTPVQTAAAGAMDIYSFLADGTNWYGSVAQGYVP